MSIRDEAIDLFENVIEKSRRLEVVATPVILTNELLASSLIRRIQAEALRDAASNVRYELGTEASGHTSTYSVRRWLDSEANRVERGK